MTEYHVIKDPVHGTMQFTSQEDSWLKPFINSSAMQRLRQIKQLGMGDLLFPGSVHTRFNHSLGCCYVAGQIANKIGLKDSDKQLIMIACLLHDVGHGPFSHAFEDLFFDRSVRHESWTPLFLSEFCHQDFFTEYNQQNPDFPLDVEKFELIQGMIMHNPSIDRLFADVVSSQLDADRFDYLLRDSHFCGVGYGEFDLRWMLHCLTIIEIKGKRRIGITRKGIGAVEQYLNARRLMVKNIYHHQKKLAVEYYLVQFLSQLSKALVSSKEYAEFAKTKLGKFLIQVDGYNKKAKNSKNLALLANDFIQDNYSLYKTLCDYDVSAAIRYFSELDDDSDVVQLAKRIQLRQLPKIQHFDDVNVEEVEAMVAKYKKENKGKIKDWQVQMIRFPHQSYNIKEDPILVEMENGEVKPINELSIIVDAISDRVEHACFVCIDQLVSAELSVASGVF